jgi:hypothetical protein
LNGARQSPLVDPSNSLNVLNNMNEGREFGETELSHFPLFTTVSQTEVHIIKIHQIANLLD